jgi:hypothetical protein
MGIIDKRKNKKFDYQPRYFENDKDGSPFEMEHRFDKFRSTVGNNKGMKGKFNAAWSDYQSGSDPRTKKTILIVIAVLVFLFLWLIDFDLSIFTQAR